MEATPDNEKYEIIAQRLATPEEEFFLNLWLRGFELSLARSNDALTRIITLGTALAGGSLVLLKEEICYGWWKVFASTLFLIGLGVGIYGAIPLEKEEAYDPEQIKQNIVVAAQWKTTMVFGSAAFLLLGLAAAVIGAAIRQAYANS